MENWKQVTISEFSHYEVSDIGRVRNSKTGKVFSNNLTPAGRHRVQLRAPGGYFKNLLVHRLVCLAFNGEPPEGKPLTLHRDGDPLNNVPQNLYWGDDADNSRDRHLHGRTTRMNATHCVNGHEFTPDNTIPRKKDGKRSCRQCKIDKANAYRRMGLPEGDPGHGTMKGYATRGCRCPLCFEWGVSYRKMLKDRHGGVMSNIGGVERRAQIENLMRSGASLSEIKRTTGADYRTVRRIDPDYRPFEVGGGGDAAVIRQTNQQLQEFLRRGKIGKHRENGFRPKE